MSSSLKICCHLFIPQLSKVMEGPGYLDDLPLVPGQDVVLLQHYVALYCKEGNQSLGIKLLSEDWGLGVGVDCILYFDW